MADSVQSYSFMATPLAIEDMHACREEDAWAASKISVFLREVTGGLRMADTLVSPNYSDEAIESVAELVTFRPIKVNAYRVKLVEIYAWRLIFAVDHPTKRVALMAVMNRDADYEKDTGLWADIEREYDELGFTRV